METSIYKWAAWSHSIIGVGIKGAVGVINENIPDLCGDTLETGGDKFQLASILVFVYLPSPWL